MSFDYDESKFTELLLYVARSLMDDPAGGAVKLNKVLFFAEFAHVRAYGRPITGAEYQKLEWGPAPRRLVPVRQELLDRGEAELVQEAYLGYDQQRLVPRRDPDTSIFRDEELAIVDQVVKELFGQSAVDTSSMSHEEMGWQMVEDRETIPYEAAFLRRPVRTEAVRQHGEYLAKSRGL